MWSVFKKRREKSDGQNLFGLHLPVFMTFLYDINLYFQFPEIFET